MLAVKVLPKGQITLPKEIRLKMHINEGDTLLLEVDGELATLRRGKTIFDFKGILPEIGKTIEEIRELGISSAVNANE